MVYTVPHFISGKRFEEHQNTETLSIFNPSIGEAIGKTHIASVATCQKVVASAAAAWPKWAQTSPLKRAQILFEFAHLLKKHQNELAELVTQEHGKTIADAKGSVARGIEVVEFHCGLASQLQGKFSTNVASGIDCTTFREPLGICAGVSPFNFPVMVPIWMIIPAIACGNTFILKPSEQDPSPSVRLLELLSEAGLPDGVANCVQGDKSVVDFLLSHPDIKAFTAVASTPVAEHIYTTATSQGKRAHTFGGAKNHGVIMPDADMDYAANAIVGAAFGSAGERCMALSVVVAVGEQTANQIVDKLIPLIKDIRIGAGDDPNVDMGPLISDAHRKRVSAAIDQGVAEGAKLLIDGRDFRHTTHSHGYFMGPSLFDEVTQTMSVYQNEIFGPVLVIMRVPDLDAAIRLVNQHQYGNGTAIFTRDGFTARSYTERVQVGMVGINIPIPVPVASHPFGGWKRSSFGDNNMHGEESIHFYTKLKTVTSKWPTTTLCANSFAMPTHSEEPTL